MTQDAFYFTQWFFQNIWFYFNSWHIPGTSMTPAALLFFCALVALVVPWLKKFFSSL